MDLENLKELGLSKGQIATYSAVLELGRASLNQIQKKTGLERRGIYDIISKLIERGLITYTIEKGKHTYQCASPNRLLDEIEEKENALKELRKQVPAIKQIHRLNIPETHAEVYRGSDGVKTFLNEVLEYKESYWLGGNNFNQLQDVPESVVTYFIKWMQKRVKQKHMMYDLIDHGIVLRGLKPDNIAEQKKNFIKICWMPKNLQTPVVIVIYGNKVAQILWSRQTFIFIVESKDLKDSYRKYFDYFWKDPW